MRLDCSEWQNVFKKQKKNQAVTCMSNKTVSLHWGRGRSTSRDTKCGDWIKWMMQILWKRRLALPMTSFGTDGWKLTLTWCQVGTCVGSRASIWTARRISGHVAKTTPLHLLSFIFQLFTECSFQISTLVFNLGHALSCALLPPALQTLEKDGSGHAVVSIHTSSQLSELPSVTRKQPAREIECRRHRHCHHWQQDLNKHDVWVVAAEEAVVGGAVDLSNRLATLHL